MKKRMLLGLVSVLFALSVVSAAMAQGKAGNRLA